MTSGEALKLPSGKLTKNDGKSPFLMGKSTISMALFNSKLFVYQRVWHIYGDQTESYRKGFPISRPKLNTGNSSPLPLKKT
jgi:hypothetical protein